MHVSQLLNAFVFAPYTKIVALHGEMIGGLGRVPHSFALFADEWDSMPPFAKFNLCCRIVWALSDT